tara:strand:+ start:213 stop:431 length:219 start_codon:yes stop_codon:yes gene_type:complete
MKKEILNTEIIALNEINYRELCINHYLYCLENNAAYKELIVNYLDYDGKVLVCNEIKTLGLTEIINQINCSF